MSPDSRVGFVVDSAGVAYEVRLTFEETTEIRNGWGTIMRRLYLTPRLYIA